MMNPHRPVSLVPLLRPVLPVEDTITVTATVTVTPASPPPFPFISAITACRLVLQARQRVTEATADLGEMEEVPVVVEQVGSLVPVEEVDRLDLEEQAGFKEYGLKCYPAFGYLGQDRRRTGMMNLAWRKE